MINGVHALVYAQDAVATRAFFRDVLGFRAVDAGRGWLIFALPPAEIAAHPADDGARHELYFMCDDVERSVRELRARGVEFTQPITDQGWGRVTRFRIPGGGEIGLYQPMHPTAIDASEGRAGRRRSARKRPAKKHGPRRRVEAERARVGRRRRR